MGRLLTQLFEITGQFGMRLRPELVLLQKTMVTVEGVARRIDPGHDIWAAARPVVERWVRREFSPVTRVRELAEEGARAVQALARAAEAPVAPQTVIVERNSRWGWLAPMLAAAALVVATAAWVFD